MPYLGNTPSTSFATVVKDSFNGGSTAYTLSKVATTNSVSVFVENVRQEPTTAYAVSGTTLTFTATTPSGTGNIYVLHMNPTTTTTHPSAQNLTAVNGTLTGTLDVTGDVAIDSDTLFVDVSQDNVGINTNAVDSDVALEVNGNVAFKNGSNYSLYADVDGALTAYHNGTAAIATASGGAVTVTNGITLSDGDLTVANGHGINFAATSDASGMASELLDDYEEGSWTPAWTGGISSATYSIQHGRYTKTGNVCTAYFYLDISNGTDGSGHAVVGGLPYTSAATMYWVATGYNNSSDNNNDNVIVICFPGTTSLYYYSQGLQGVSQIPGNNLGHTTSQLWQITYRTA